ncbi:MAG: tRNA (adenosine(37)-N6)-threonylcarbamoyltransferase complex ATPase subunit type 1 TsaE [Pseudomonadota bacterium]
MYREFYNFSEKPFTLLPDPGFLYMSDKHRMAFTLLEYGLMNHAGFTVISGDIGAGKTTLIRHLLDNMDREHTVGLISNTHRSFGELLHWVLLAFNLDHANLSKVEMHQRFVDFIIDEYAHNRRTVLIVDEAQNMSAETLEELRMLSNINADKDQALQVVLVGQNELRDTLQRPDLVQFAQRISVDYHLQPLSEDETVHYIRHRLKVAGGSPDIFSDLACKAVHRYSNGVPRLINLLCDTALVYGYAEQKWQIDARLVIQVAQEKQKGGIFPTFEPALEDDFPEEELKPAELPDQAQADSATLTVTETEAKPVTEDVPDAETPALLTREGTSSDIQPDTLDTSKSEGDLYWEQQGSGQPAKKKVRLALCAEKEVLRQYLSRLLESYGFDVIKASPLGAEEIKALNPVDLNILLIDRAEDCTPLPADVANVLASWDGPVLYNDTTATAISLKQADPNFGQLLADRIHSLAEAS